MLSVAHTIRIESPPDRVWPVLADVQRWPRFAPQFRSIERKDEGPLAPGSAARVTPFGFWGSTWTVTECSDGRSFTWQADMLPGARLVGGHLIEPDGNGTRLTLSLKALGPVATLLSPVLGLVFRRNTRQAGEGMKAYCEGGDA